MNGSGPHADLYQMLAYCTVLGLPLGRLVYAAGDEEPIQHAVRRAETIIETTTLDLSKPIPELLSDVAGLAERIAATSSTPAAGAQLCGPFEVITLGRYSLEDWKGYVLDGDGQAVQAEDLGRYPPEQEAAVYFCSLEALQNIAKYARATRATVRLEEQDGHLTSKSRTTGPASTRPTFPTGRGCRAWPTGWPRWEGR